MRRRTLLSVAVVFLVTTQLNFGQDAKKDTDKLQGNWELLETLLAGMEWTGGATFTFAGDKMTMKSGIFTAAGTFKLDETTSPKSIDLIGLEGDKRGESSPGIYRFDGEKLQICIATKKTKDRPKEFASPEGSIYVHYTLKRAKK